MVDLIQRHELILKQITPFNEPEKKANYDPQRRYFLLAEYCLVMDTMHERDKIARYEVADGSGKKIFISHSKKDKWLANTMAADLKLLGHDPWVDEIKIKAGDSIPKAIQEGVNTADYIIVIISNNSNQSQWVEIEWMSKFWDEIQKRQTIIIPALLEPCEIPHLLKSKKYADFTCSYQKGFDEIMKSIFR